MYVDVNADAGSGLDDFTDRENTVVSAAKRNAEKQELLLKRQNRGSSQCI